MIKLKNITLSLLLLPFFIHSQVNINEDIIKEINEQIFNSESYPRTIVQSNKRYKTLKGPIKEEIILYSDSIKIINHYNNYKNLTESKVYKNNKLKKEFIYTYKNKGKVLTKERGIYNLDYYISDKYNSFALKSTIKEKGLNRYLDTLFIKKTKNKYELTRKSKLNRIPVKNYKFKYNPSGDLKSILIFKNSIRVGHLINIYNDNNKVEKQELFWDYQWFYHDTGFPSVRNSIFEIVYNDKGLIKTIKKQNYNPLKHKWEKTITNYQSVITKGKKLIKANFSTEYGVNTIIEIDHYGNWVRKTEDTITTKRLLKYYK